MHVCIMYYCITLKKKNLVIFNRQPRFKRFIKICSQITRQQVIFKINTRYSRDPVTSFKLYLHIQTY